MLSDEQRLKLPKAAQTHISRLEARIFHLEEQVQSYQGEMGNSRVYWMQKETKVFLPDDTPIFFQVGREDRRWLQVYFDPTWAGLVKIMAGSELEIRSNAANSIYLGVE